MICFSEKSSARCVSLMPFLYSPKRRFVGDWSQLFVILFRNLHPNSFQSCLLPLLFPLLPSFSKSTDDIDCIQLTRAVYDHHELKNKSSWSTNFSIKPFFSRVLANFLLTKFRMSMHRQMSRFLFIIRFIQILIWWLIWWLSWSVTWKLISILGQFVGRRFNLAAFLRLAVKSIFTEHVDWVLPFLPFLSMFAN